MSNRTLRVNELIQRELSAILRQRHQSEAVAVTITEIRVSPDLRDARVFVSVIGSDDFASVDQHREPSVACGAIREVTQSRRRRAWSNPGATHEG